MPSPFPGMDPYLEDPAIWPDFHLTFLISLRAEINDLLPAGYTAIADRHVWIHDEEEPQERLLGRPDVYVTDAAPSLTTNGKTVTLEAPNIVTLPALDEKGSPYLTIRDVRDRRVITVVELLSPANKTPGRQHEAYLAKRAEYLAARVNLVEMDFLRLGERPPLGMQVDASHYYLLVRRFWDSPRAGLWTFSVRDPFPSLPLPLRSQEEPIEISLKTAFNRSYHEGRYDHEINYQQPPEVPLSPTDEAWARHLLVSWKSA